MSHGDNEDVSSVTKVHVLETDGLSRYLYGYLWKLHRYWKTTICNHPDTTTDTTSGGAAPSPTGSALKVSQSHSPRGGPFAHPGELKWKMMERAVALFPSIPDTVVFEHSFPQAWYTYDDRNKELTKHHGKELDTMEIYKGFAAAAGNGLTGGVCAQFVGMDKDVPSVLYLTAETLLPWLREKNPPKNGILQTFIAPRHAKNEAFVATWSPTTMSVVRHSSVHALTAVHVPPQTRCPTFDAPPHLVDVTVGNKSIEDRIEKVLSLLAEFVLKSEHKVVARMTAVFKIDAQNTLWFLHASSIRVANDSSIGSYVVRDPVDAATQYRVHSNRCGDELVREALQLTTTTATVHQPPSPFVRRALGGPTLSRLAGSDGAGGATQPKRRDTKELLERASKWCVPAAAKATAVDLQALKAFVDDTLYALYAARMTTHKSTVDPRVLIHFPRRLRLFLEESGTEELMVSIFRMEEVIGNRPHDQHETFFRSRLLDGSEKRRPISIVRGECQQFLERLRNVYGVD